MKEGYQKSPVGIFPSDWKIKRLKKVADFSNGKGHEKYIDEAGQFSVVNSKFVSTSGEVVKFSKKNLSPLFKGDIAMVMSDIPNGKAIAKCFLIDIENKYTLNQRICAIQASEQINTKFLFYVLNRNKYYLAFDNGVSQTNLRKDEVLDCPIQVPPLPEQQKIAEILSTVDAKIEIIDQQISETSELKKGLMQRLLTKGIGHTKFKDSALGEIPESWEVKRFGETLISSPQYGANASAIPFGKDTFRYIRITDILENGNLTNDKIVGIPKIDGLQYKLSQDDILIARTGNTVGKSFLYDVKYGDCSFAGYLIRFRTDTSILLSNYILQFLHSNIYWNWIESTIRTGAQPNVNSKEYQSMQIALPPVKEQQQIAEILSSVDDKLQVLSEKKVTYQELKQGLMQQLLTGKVRVKV